MLLAKGKVLEAKEMTRVAILPAAGIGLRMAVYKDRPKQLLPLANGVVIDYPLRAARECGAWPHVIVPRGDMQVVRHVAEQTPYVTFSHASPGLLRAIMALEPIYGTAEILYIMSDTIFEPISIGSALMEQLSDDNPVSVAVFETDCIDKYGMCEVEDSMVVETRDKPKGWDGTPFAWGLLAWVGPFWDCIKARPQDNMTEALAEGIRRFGPAPAVELTDYIDIGTPEDYVAASERGW